MRHDQHISAIRNRQVAKLLADIDGDSLPPMLVRSIKKHFSFMASDFETYVTTVTGENNGQDDIGNR